ncbi:alanyl-tRNA editing protein [Haloparvum sp. PAK95]|uniref:alanyl-tRNA editing protein n=1 Tax=Haloparvum sp. PAK95 TaxID=3418962 RepID=UPI003D2EDE54
MPRSRAPAEPDVRHFETVVDRVDGDEVVLAETYFYPEAGGQPADRGTIDGVALADVQERDGEVVHTLDADAANLDLAAGDTVVCDVDDAFRTYCMRAHTASHVLYGAARRLFDDLGYAGFDIGLEKVRVDLTTAEPIDDADLVELGRLSNRAVWDSLPVTWETTSAEEARSLPDIAFNEKTEEGAMSDGGTGAAEGASADSSDDGDGTADDVRVVTVEGWDTAACGGTHVANTREIGPIEVLDRSNPGEGRTRVEFAVGPTAIDRDAAVHGAALEAARALDTSPADLLDAVERLQAERDELAAELSAAERDLLDAALADLDSFDRDGQTWAVGAVDGFGPNDVGDAVQEMVGEGDDDPDVAAVAGRDGAAFVVVASTGEHAAGDVVDRVTTEFGGGGGGGPTFAQGGGLGADPTAVVEFLREEL